MKKSTRDIILSRAGLGLSGYGLATLLHAEHKARPVRKRLTALQKYEDPHATSPSNEALTKETAQVDRGLSKIPKAVRALDPSRHSRLKTAALGAALGVGGYWGGKILDKERQQNQTRIDNLLKETHTVNTRRACLIRNSVWEVLYDVPPYQSAGDKRMATAREVTHRFRKIDKDTGDISSRRKSWKGWFNLETEQEIHWNPLRHVHADLNPETGEKGKRVAADRVDLRAKGWVPVYYFNVNAGEAGVSISDPTPSELSALRHYFFSKGLDPHTLFHITDELREESQALALGQLGKVEHYHSKVADFRKAGLYSSRHQGSRHVREMLQRAARI